MKGIIVAVGMVALLAASAKADYLVDPKWSQKPDTTIYGFDFSSESLLPSAVADDWRCAEAGSLRDLHWWGSFFCQAPLLMRYSDHYVDPSIANPAAAHATVTGFQVTFYQDVPAGTGGPSHPGAVIGTPQVISQFSSSYFYRIDRNGDGPDERDEIIWQYNASLPVPFVQEGSRENPVVYWLSIVALNAPQGAGAPPIQWGWHESIDHNLDAAVQTGRPDLWGQEYADWVNMGVKDMAFELAVPEPATMALMGGGLALMALARRNKRAAK